MTTNCFIAILSTYTVSVRLYPMTTVLLQCARSTVTVCPLYESPSVPPEAGPVTSGESHVWTMECTEVGVGGHYCDGEIGFIYRC